MTTVPVFKWVKIVSHRSAPQGTEGMNDFSLRCAVLYGYSSL
jgi:hypothetical protein